MPSDGERRVAARLQWVQAGNAEPEQERHRRQQDPALPLAADHAAEGVGQGRADQQISPISTRFVSGVGFSNG